MASLGEITLSKYLDSAGVGCIFISNFYNNGTLENGTIGIVESYNKILTKPSYTKELVYLENINENNDEKILTVKPIIKVSFSGNQICTFNDGYQLYLDKNGNYSYYIDGYHTGTYNFMPFVVTPKNINSVKRIQIQNGEYIEKDGIDCTSNGTLCDNLESVSISEPEWISTK